MPPTDPLPIALMIFVMAPAVLLSAAALIAVLGDAYEKKKDKDNET